MLIPASTSVTINRTTQQDQWGDYADINNEAMAVATGVPAAIGSTSTTAQNPASGTPRQISVLTAVVPNGTDVQVNDRLTDQETGVVYSVDQVNPGTSYGYTADIVLKLSAVGG